MNKDTWDGLEAQTQALFETSCTATTLRSLSRGEAIQGAVIRGFQEKGVQSKSLPVEMLAELKVLTDAVMAEQVAADADFAKVYESQEAFAESYQTWKGLAYLSRDFGVSE